MTTDKGHSRVKRYLRLGLCPTPEVRSTAHSALMNFGLIGMMTIVAVESGTTPAQAALLADWGFDPATNQLQITLQDKTTPRYFLLAQPARIVLELPNTQLGKVATQQNYSGAVRQVRVSQFQEGVTRIVLELSPKVVLAPGQVELQRAKPQRGKSDRWLLRPLIAEQSTPAQMQKLPPLPSTLPPATFGSQQPDVVSVPPLRSPNVDPGQSRSTTTSTSSQPTDQLPQPYRAWVIEFGQPLPKATP